MTNTKPIITIKGLKKAYHADELVLKGIDLEILPGQVLGYIGPNGAGKTTTVKILIGMIPEYQGEVKVDGFDMSENPLEVKKRIGYVPETAALYDSLTPVEYLHFLGKIHEIPDVLLRQRMEKMLEIFGLDDQKNSRMNTFSKGMKQKILIIGSMIHDPDILFLDEPLTGLDANMALVVKEILAQLAEKGKTIFYCSHVMDVVERICDRIIIIDRGILIADGSFDELQAMNKGESLERIFAQLTGSSGHADIAGDFISNLGGGTTGRD